MSPFDAALFFRTIWIALTIGILATALAIPAAWSLRRLGATGGTLLVAPMLVPSHLVYSSWGLLRAPGSALGDWLAQAGSDPMRGPDVWSAVSLTHAMLALALWAWPIAALVMSLWTRAIERDGLDAMRCLGAGRIRQGMHVARLVAPGAVLAGLLVSAMMLGSAVPLHLANQPTYSLVIWSEMAQGNARGAWRASWPMFVLAAIAGVAVTIALARGVDPSRWRAQGRDRAVGLGWLLVAALIWSMSVLVPMGLVLWNLGDWARAAHFWSAVGPRFDRGEPGRLLASLETAIGVVVCCAAIGAICALGFGHSARWAMRGMAITVLGMLAMLFFVPGVLVGAALASWDPTRSSLAGLILAHVARYGLLAAAAGMLLGRSEARELHDARRLFAPGLSGWARGVVWPQLGLIVGALGAVALLSMHEIESAVLLARAGHATLSQYMLDLLHYARTDELLGALFWMQGLGIVCATAVAMCTTGWRKGLSGGFVRAAPLLLVAAMAMLGACERVPTTESGALQVVRAVGHTGRGPGELVFPRAVDFDGQSLWVIDKTARVQRFDLDGKAGPGWTMPRRDRGRPCGITCGRDGLTYVADTHEHRVAIYRPTPEGGELVRSIGVYGTGPGQFIYPTDVAIALGPDGMTAARFYVSEYGGNDRISVFDADWNFLQDIRGGPSGLARPQSIAFDDARQELIVVDSSHHRLGVFSPTGELVRWIGKQDDQGPVFGDEPGAFSQPFGLALLGDHTALVTEIGTQRVQRIDLQTGACLATFGRGGWGEDELIQPWAVAAAGKYAWVLDSGKDRIVMFRHGGAEPTGPAAAVARSVRIGEDASR